MLLLSYAYPTHVAVILFLAMIIFARSHQIESFVNKIAAAVSRTSPFTVRIQASPLHRIAPIATELENLDRESERGLKRQRQPSSETGKDEETLHLVEEQEQPQQSNGRDAFLVLEVDRRSLEFTVRNASFMIFNYLCVSLAAKIISSYICIYASMNIQYLFD